MIISRPMSPEDLPEILALDLRDYDKMELKALRPDTPMSEIIGEAARSPDVNVAIADDQILGLFGARPHDEVPEFGVVWAFGINKAYDHMDELNLLAAQMISEWLDRFPAGIGNCMSLLNKPAMRWIKGFGFKFQGEVLDINGTPFQMFARYSHV